MPWASQAVRFAGADPPPGAGAALDTFLADGRHGDMAWLAANSERRKSPRAIWPDVKSIIMLGMSYGPERDPLAALLAALARRHLRLCAGRRLSRRHQVEAESRSLRACRTWRKAR